MSDKQPEYPNGKGAPDLSGVGLLLIETEHGNGVVKYHYSDQVIDVQEFED